MYEISDGMIEKIIFTMKGEERLEIMLTLLNGISARNLRASTQERDSKTEQM